MMLLVAASAGALQAQSAGVSTAADSRLFYGGVKNFIIRAAEKMPAENYGFKPTPEVRSFGQLFTHIADLNTEVCGLVKGEKKTPNAASKTTKADIQAALKESFDYCDTAYNALTDANAGDAVDFFRGKKTRVGVLDFNTAHDNEMYGTIAVYLRLKGLIPPSSEPPPQQKGK